MVSYMFEPTVSSVWDLLQLFKEKSRTDIPGGGEGEGGGGQWACLEMSEPLSRNVQNFTAVNFDIMVSFYYPVNTEENR